jgi:hypothetical protein
MMDNVSPAKFRDMCERSRILLARAGFLERAGARGGAKKLWQELRPLNCRIRLLSEMPSDGSPSSRKANNDHA